VAEQLLVMGWWRRRPVDERLKATSVPGCVAVADQFVKLLARPTAQAGNRPATMASNNG
jgi:hypothetical protein